ncbi:hypothetical protein SERLA73DRAFT_175262 [Serpula lacrymans var. lacrymans S7.3]|uniref:Alpha/beta hydrolase fold-3 domain-containing protein n=2 Tax=Serpula lacrymans var. lacrymans TaxID=341189 RepID=F8PIQ0_SERL3|nr:uncharacterized protein SERLADRAFT_457439 [Serpula lacrymans var. lacrymans S7.9]EGO03683.1 hypothetical protein SERLA73DRAFT_175262 [Serpula lacrymans var. lacrymans S7.3]EGO29549.1 hypothetical protein SERLADRAFT_457439 [Serpula lacrymans var. lacrymans S7.9]
MFWGPLWPFQRGLTVDPSPPIVAQSRSPNTVVLRDYDTPGVLPASARIDTTLKILDNPAMRVWDAWKYPAFVVYKATTIARDILSHHLWGPRRKSWGIEMTIISSVMRDVAQHAALADIATVRIFLGLTGLVPLPSDALVTPVTFCVRRRNLRGLLLELDSKETGDRKLSGEWVVGKKLWQSLQAEYETARRPREGSSDPDDSRPKRKARVILYVHGGAYYSSSASAQRLITIPLSKYTNSRVFAIDYRLAPETCFPGPLHDVVIAYFRLIDDLHVPPESVIVAGDSAGGGLCLALVLYLRDNGYPLPGGSILFSPWVDLTLSCESWDSNRAFDVVPTPGPGAHLHPVVMYLGNNLREYVAHPYASPLFGDYNGLPPMLIQSGDAEVLMDEHILLAQKASRAGVEVRHELYEDAVHVFQSFPFLDATTKAFQSCRQFVLHHLPHLQQSDPRILDNAAESHLEDEITNENIIMVRGDGVETASGKQGVNEKMKEDEQSEEVGNSGEEEYPSWGLSSGNLTSALRSESGSPISDFSSNAGVVGSTSRTFQSASTTIPRLHRVKSALSILKAESMPTQTTANETAQRLRPRGHSVTIRQPNLGMSHIIPRSASIRDLR